MYTVERKSNFIETLCLKNKKNNTQLMIDVKINLTKTMNIFEKKMRALQIAQLEIQKGGQDFKKVGDAILDIIEIIFGNDDGKKIIDFYDGDYAELLIDLFPFIIGVVVPAYQKANKQRQKEIKQRIRKL